MNKHSNQPNIYYLSTYLPIYLPICITNLPTYLPTYPIYLSNLPTYLSAYLSIQREGERGGIYKSGKMGKSEKGLMELFV